MKKFTGILAAAAISGFMMMSTSASAAVADCATESPDVTGDVTPNDGCQFSDTLGPDQPTLAEINAEMFFGIDDWTEAGKVNTQDGTNINESNGDLTIDGNNLSGDWEIANLDASYFYLLLFKDGNNAEPGIVVGYLVSAAMGTYDGVFSNKPDGGISNIQLLMSKNPDCCDNTDIPLPAAGFLLIGALGALGGLGAYRRRRT